MRKHVLVVCAAMCAAFLVPAQAGAVQITQHVTKPVAGGSHFVVMERTVDVAPLDSDQDGVADTDDNCPNTMGSAAFSGCPPPPAPVPAQAAPTQYSSPTSTSTPVVSGGGAGCVGMEAESGTTGYATDTGNGYIGCYQISMDHFDSGGSCAGDGTDPAGQDACAATICATEGAGAWTNDAGENPCGRLGG